MATETKGLLEENVGKLVTVIAEKGLTGILLRDDGKDSFRKLSGLSGFRIIAKSREDFYMTFYCGKDNCTASMKKGSVVIRLDLIKGYDMSFAQKPDYDCSLKKEIEMLETALAGGRSA